MSQPESSLKLSDTLNGRKLPSLTELAPFSKPAFLANPYPAYARLRKEAPVWWCERSSTWIITQYNHVRSVVCDPDSFSSAPRGRKRPPYDDPGTEMLLNVDPPKHRPARRIFVGNGAYTAEATEKRRPRIVSACQEIISRLPNGAIDAVGDVALPAVVALAQEFFALPDPEPGEPRWQDFLVGYYAPGTGDATQGLVRYLERVVRSRREEPGDDPISLAVTANDRQQLLTDTQIAWNFYDAILAGAASTLAVTAESINALAQNSDMQQTRYWASVDAAKRSTEELLRWTSHLHVVNRTATREITLGDQLIRSGDAVRAVIASANRDEAVWEHGEQLDLEREPKQANFTFGYGPHIATGAMLARVFISTLLRIFIIDRRPFALSDRPSHARTLTISTPLRIPIK